MAVCLYAQLYAMPDERPEGLNLIDFAILFLLVLKIKEKIRRKWFLHRKYAVGNIIKTLLKGNFHTGKSSYKYSILDFVATLHFSTIPSHLNDENLQFQQPFASTFCYLLIRAKFSSQHQPTVSSDV